MTVPQYYISLEFDPYLPWNRGILKGVGAYAYEHPELHLLLHRMLPRGHVEFRGMHEFADGFISEHPSSYAVERDLPQVVIGAGGTLTDLPKVYTDFFAVGTLAASHLLEKGYPVLACFEYYSEDSVDLDRDRGFREKASERGVEVIDVKLPSGTNSSRQVIDLGRLDAVLTALRQLPRPTGFFARNLNELYLAHYLFQESGLQIPNEIGLIVGGNDRDMLESLKPSITGISRNSYGIGYRAAELVHEMFLGQKVDLLTSLPPRGVIDRGSTQLEALADPVVSWACDLIRDRIGQPILLGEIALAVGVSESSLRRRFQKTLHRSPNEEVQRARLERAKEMLEKSELSVSEVSHRCGYAEPAQLSRAIKSATGLTPTGLRNHFLRSRAGH